MTTLGDRLQAAVGDRFRIERELEGGGMSRVFVATELSLNRQVVIKLLDPERTSRSDRARFQRELDVTALLQHPHILPVLTTGARDDLLWYVMPYVEGESLRHRLLCDGRLPIEAVTGILMDLLGALQYAHARGVIHRDIKPENILLSNGVAVLADFGIAAVHDEVVRQTTRLTLAGTTLGTPGYMSPEQAAGDPGLDARSDLYALAVVGYEMLTGQPPFDGPTPQAIVAAHLTTTPPPIASRRPETPTALAAALTRALAKAPAERFRDAAEFRAAITARPGWRSRLPRPRWIAAGVAAAGALALAARLVRPDTPTATLDPMLIAIAPFDVLSADLELWREGLVDVLAANLDGAGPIRTVPPVVSLRRWQERRDRASVAQFGRANGAGIALVGRLVRSGRDSVRLTARVIDVEHASERGTIDLSDGVDRVDRLTDSLSLRVLRILGESFAVGATRRAPIGSMSLPAVRAYLRAEQFLRRSAWDSAIVYYRQALDYDSLFAPALRHLGSALGWERQILAGGDLDMTADKYLLRAGALNHGLAPRESLLVAADSLSAAIDLSTDDRSALALSRRLLLLLQQGVARFPDDPEVWYELGDAGFHYGGYVPSLMRPAMTQHALARAIQLDSAFAPAYLHAVYVDVASGDLAEARRRINSYLGLVSDSSTEFTAAVAVMQVLLDPARLARTSIDSLLRGLRDADVATVAYMSALIYDSTDVNIRLMQAIHRGIGRGQWPILEQRAETYLGYAYVSRGRYREALPWMNQNNIGSTFLEGAILGALPRDSADALFASWLPDLATNPLINFALYWWASQRDTLHLATAAARLDDEPLEPVARGFLALARGDTAAAIAGLSVPDSICGIVGCSLLRFPLARIHARHHQWREALDLLEQIGPGPLYPLWQLERAHAYEAVADTVSARNDYQQIIAAWNRGDPETQPFVAEARDALVRLAVDAPAP